MHIGSVQREQLERDAWIRKPHRIDFDNNDYADTKMDNITDLRST
jgi:hypothetical protein